MFQKIEGGSVMNIQGIECQLPPVGYVFNVATKQLEHREIYKRSEIESEQYWERIPLPLWYKETIKREDNYEKKRKEEDELFYDERLEEYKKQEWDRRLNGFWFYNNGVPVYLVGSHYFFIQWFSIDIGYPKFRFPDLEYFYFLQYCIEDNNCMGMLEITKRRFGKTYRGGVFITEYPTRTKMTNGGIQSKTGGDAKKVFAKAVINPFKKLPRFFRPEYDMSLGITPKSEIRFQQTNTRGKKAEEGLDKEELGSLIDFQSADMVAYDGQKLHRYFSDEWAKTVECNIYDRHDVIRYCLLDDEGNIIGKALYSSTVEQLETEKDGVQEAAINLWNDSDQLNKGENGRTASGLYRFFMTADRARNFDIYGIPDVEKTIKAIIADRATVKHNQRALAARIRKEARTIEEAFYAGNDKCEFNAENITIQLEELKANPVYLRQCRLVSKMVDVPNGFGKMVKNEKIGFMDDERGGWFMLERPNRENQFIERSGQFEPSNTMNYQIGVDTTQDGRIAANGSDPVILVFKKSCMVNGEELGMYPVMMWISPTRLDIHFDEEVLKACKFFGCKANYEIDRRTDFIRYFNKENCVRFLDWTPKYFQNPAKRGGFKPEIGSRSGDPFQLSQQLQVCKSYVDGTDNEVFNGHVQRIKFPTLLMQLLKYNHAMRTPYDQVVSLMMALAPVIGEQQQPVRPQRTKPILQTYELKCK